MLKKLRKLKIGAKVMLTVKVHLAYGLIKSQTGSINHTEFAQGIVCKVYVKISDEQPGSKAMKSSYLGRQNSWVPIEKCETHTSISALNIL